MEFPLVVGVDGSEDSLRALEWATDEAARGGLGLRVVHASLWERYEVTPPVFGAEPAGEVISERVVAAAVERARRRAPDVKVSGAVIPLDAGRALVEAGREAAALVIGSRGRGGLAELLLGSVSLVVASRAVCPVVVVRRAHRRQQGETGPVVLGVGDVLEDSSAVEFAFREAESLGRPLHAVHAWQAPPRGHRHGRDGRESSRTQETRAASALSEALREAAAEHGQVQVRRSVSEGPARTVLREASSGASLLVVGAPRRRGPTGHGPAGLQLGHTAHSLLHHAGCPVAVVPEEG
jgi:nucleotide-binding universal stress UspA family protein